jgi:hypothetical protein
VAEENADFRDVIAFVTSSLVKRGKTSKIIGI